MTPKLVNHLLYEPEDSGILWIKFNRPERMNALIGSSEENGTVAKVGEYMRAGDDDPDIRVIVLTGVGRGFCSGADMRRDTPAELKGENFVGNRNIPEGLDAARERFFHGFTKLHRDISLIRKPTIAMINGPAVGAGMDMSLHCDIRIGCENTRFVGYQQLGQIMENGGSYYLPKMVGLGRALEFAYTGQLDAKRAYDYVRPLSAVRVLFGDSNVTAWAGPTEGVKAIPATAWRAYQELYFATPPFPEYVSGHSTFSFAAAEVLKTFTGSDAFGAFAVVKPGTSAIETGRTPKAEVELRWPTFTDAATQAALSRRYGGIHFAQGDLEARKMGRIVGEKAWQRAQGYFEGTATPASRPFRNLYATAKQ